MRRLLPGIFSLLLVFSLAATALGESGVTFREEFTFSPGSVFSTTDLFPDFKNVMPGDRLEETVSLKNRHTGKLRLHLRADPPEENRAFLSQLWLTLRLEDTVLFSGSPAEVFDSKSLGVLQPGEEAQLRVTLDVPAALENTYASARGDVLWVFTAEQIPGDPLIQTGQEVLHILLLAGFGIFCVILGAILLKKRNG